MPGAALLLEVTRDCFCTDLEQHARHRGADSSVLASEGESARSTCKGSALHVAFSASPKD